MASYQHKSDAQKRKQKREDSLITSKLPKISSYFSTPTPASVPPVQSNTESEMSVESAVNVREVESAVDVREVEISECTYSSSLDVAGDENPDEGSSTSLPTKEIVQSTESTKSGDDFELLKSTEVSIESIVVGEKHVTDRGHYPITIMDSNVKRFIIAHGPCRPPGPFPRDDERRCFSESYYVRVTKTGLKIPVMWLCYSPKLNVAYCEPCWLFGDRKKTGFEPAWAKGIQKWQRLSARIQARESSKTHIEACVVYEQWRKNKTIDEENEKQIRQEKNYWRQVLHKIVNVTLTMSMANLSFRGHREKLGEVNNGNFLSIIELLAEYDPVLKQLLQLPQKSVRYLSPRIQNEIIDILSNKVRNIIVSEIKQAPFFSIIMDTTQDISKVDQMSQIIRYVSVERDESQRATSVEIKEVFLGFHAVEDQSAAGLEHDISSCIESNGLNITKCRGQGYDGAATMSGVYSGVQARIAQREKNALYVHCTAHNLNLVLQDAVGNIPEISSFFEVVQELYVFLGESIRRWNILSSFSTESSITLKKLCPTRWSSRHDSLLALRFRFVDIMQALTKINLISSKPKERDDAARLRNKLGSFQFVCLVLQSKIFDTINVVSKLLQSKNIDLSSAAHLIQKAAPVFSKYRDNFDGAKQTAVELAEKWNIQPQFENKRARKVKRHFDELSIDERLQDPEQYFKTGVFYRCLDIVTNQLSNRFAGMSNVMQRFNILQPTVLASETDDDLFKAASQLQECYPEDMSPAFPEQLLSFRSTFQEEIRRCSTVKDLSHLLIVENCALSSNLQDVCIALLLFLTIPVTVASAERSFSKLKFIKNYLRSTMSQQRLSGLALLSIENQRARRLNIEAIVDNFAEMKARQRPF
ncbi:zinc finger MYM-type protein 1-like [Bufo gargarizans]|uniref:zinc finger MYM-type protein 1-like n=1 Tax=Bufo gargarizans TaxID=30331 RepID=UPI001CF54147|nr:zinc finger MYM-type protein 1-like [Bufo gargarizans]